MSAVFPSSSTMNIDIDSIVEKIRADERNKKNSQKEHEEWDQLKKTIDELKRKESLPVNGNLFDPIEYLESELPSIDERPILYEKTDVSNLSLKPLRDYQSKKIDDAREALKTHNKVLIYAPTGAGKTLIAMHIIKLCLERDKSVTFVCDRDSLIEQTIAVAEEYGIRDYGVIKAGHKRRKNKRFQIASVQTLARAGMVPTDLVIIDECHTQYAITKAYMNFISKKQKVIGLTASPFTAGLGNYYSHVVSGATIKSLTKENILVPIKLFTCTAPDMTGARISSTGEWTNNAASERVLTITGDIVSEYLKHAFGKKTFCFCPTISACREVAKQFAYNGINGYLYTSKTSDEDRKMLLKSFRQKDTPIKILFTVEALAKGVDIPDIECIIDARPFRKSFSSYVQIIGRGTRASPNKEHLILLDHSGNMRRFIGDYEHLYHYGVKSLDESTQLDKKVRETDPKIAIPCPSCGANPFSQTCVACGFELSSKTSFFVTEPGILSEREVCIGLPKVKGKIVWTPQTIEHEMFIYEQVASYAKIHSEPQKQVWRALKLYESITKTKKPSYLVFAKQKMVEITPEIANKIKSINIAMFFRNKKKNSGLRQLNNLRSSNNYL